MRFPHLLNRLAVIIGFAVLLTFELATTAAAQCLAKEHYTHAAIVDAERAGQARQSDPRRYHMMRSGYNSLARAEDESCDDTSLNAKGTVVEAWLGTYLAHEKVAAADGTRTAACKSLYLAEAREGLVLSWLELIRTQGILSQTRLFRQAMSAVQQDAGALSMKLPPLTADQAVIDSFVRLHKTETATALKAALNASCGDVAERR